MKAVEAPNYIERRDALRDLASREAYPEHRIAWVERLNSSGNDVEIATLTASNLARHLSTAIRDAAGQLERQRGVWKATPELELKLGPLIERGWKSRVLGPATRASLTTIKEIRNALVHTEIPIDFRTPAIESLCTLLTMPSMRRPRSLSHHLISSKIEAVKGNSRQMFLLVCEALAHNLLFYALDARSVIPTDFNPGADYQPIEYRGVRAWTPTALD